MAIISWQFKLSVVPKYPKGVSPPIGGYMYTTAGYIMLIASTICELIGIVTIIASGVTFIIRLFENDKLIKKKKSNKIWISLLIGIALLVLALTLNYVVNAYDIFKYFYSGY